MRFVRVAALGLVAAALTVPAASVDAATIVGEYTPGVTGAALGGQLTVNGYGVQGIGAHRFALDDGASALGMCIQAEVSHSTSANYQPSDPVMSSGALDYLTWRYLTGSGPSDVDAAGMAVAVWSITGAQRRGGGTVVPSGEIAVNVAGVGRRSDIESAAARFIGEAIRRRGPWTMSDVTVDGGMASVRLDGPGGAISGRTVTFRLGAAGRADDWEATSDTNDHGVAAVDIAAAGPLAGRTLTATTTGPGRAVEMSAPGAQRFALAGAPVELSATYELPAVAPTTTTTSTTTSTTTPTTTTAVTSTTTTTTAVPSTTTSTTVPPAPTATTTVTTSIPDGPTTTTTTPPATTTTDVPESTIDVPETVGTTGPPPPADTTTATSAPDETIPETLPPDSSPPPDMPVTGGSTRTVVRVGAALFALGALATLAVAGNRHQRRPDEGSR